MDSGGPLSQRAYAARRGVSHMAVQRAIKAGRLKECLNDGGQIVDPDLADREWDQKTDLSKAPSYVKERAAPGAPAGGEPVAVLGGSLAENNAAKTYWQARQAELKFKREAGELVPAADVRGELETVFRTCKGRLLGIPTRAVAELPELGVAGAQKLEMLIREALEELATWKGVGT